MLSIVEFSLKDALNAVIMKLVVFLFDKDKVGLCSVVQWGKSAGDLWWTYVPSSSNSLTLHPVLLGLSSSRSEKINMNEFISAQLHKKRTEQILRTLDKVVNNENYKQDSLENRSFHLKKERKWV